MKRIIYSFFGLLIMLIWNEGIIAQGVNPGTAHLKHLWTFEDGTLKDPIGGADGEFHGTNILIDGGDLINYPDATSGQADSWVELPGAILELATYEEISVAAWFTPAAGNNQWESLWFFGNDGNGAGVGSDGFAFQPRRNDNRARTWISCGNESAPYNIEDGVNDMTGNYNDEGVLYHVVCQIANVGVQGQLMMYRDGNLIGTADLTSDASTGKDNRISNISPKFGRLCHSTYSGDIPWVGMLHEIMIFDKALSDDEVKYLFAAGVNGFPGTTSVNNKGAEVPQAFSLSQNYPNPFNPTTVISYQLPTASNVSLKVYNLLGQEAATLFEGTRQPGTYQVTFDGSKLASGVYLYRMTAGNFVETRRLVLVR
jgi:hypothetical protein